MITIENLKEIKERFELFKSDFDKRYFYFLIGYFSPVIITLVLLSKFFRDIYNIFFVRLVIFIFVLIGVMLHFLLKYLYFKSNKSYINFINNELERFKKFYSTDEEFNQKLLDISRDIFEKENTPYTEENIKKSTFFFNLNRIIKKR